MPGRMQKETNSLNDRLIQIPFSYADRISLHVPFRVEESLC
jgi:hypothetical protein